MSEGRIEDGIMEVVATVRRYFAVRNIRFSKDADNVIHDSNGMKIMVLEEDDLLAVEKQYKDELRDAEDKIKKLGIKSDMLEGRNKRFHFLLGQYEAQNKILKAVVAKHEEQKETLKALVTKHENENERLMAEADSMKRYVEKELSLLQGDYDRLTETIIGCDEWIKSNEDSVGKVEELESEKWKLEDRLSKKRKRLRYFMAKTEYKEEDIPDDSNDYDSEATDVG